MSNSNSNNNDDIEPTELDVLLNPYATASKDGGQHRRTRSLFAASKDDATIGRGHRKTRSSMRDVFESIGSGLETVVEDVRSSAELIPRTFVSELREAESGNKFFLDMSMTRSLSLLPEAIGDFVEDVTGIEKQEHVTEGSMATRYMALGGAVLAISSNGTALSLLHDVDPSIKLYWRMTATATVLSFFAMRNIYSQGPPKLSFGHWISFGSAVLCFTVHTLLVFNAFTWTSIGNVLIFANSQALLLILGKAFVGETVVLMEGIGVVVAFSGAILCSQAPESGSGNTPSNVKNSAGDMSYVGDLMALGSAVAGVGYLTYAKALRSEMNVTVFMFSVMFVGSFVVLLFMVTAGIPFSFSNDPNNGLFGWLNLQEDRFYIVFYIAGICNVLGTMGFVRAMQYFENIIIAVATLLEPMIASLMAYIFHVGLLPGPLGWLGNLLVVVGTLCVIYPSIDKGVGGGH
jgi:drug/metabolite transporter (DMT)-like permease